jgi:hypothetical protein
MPDGFLDRFRKVVEIDHAPRSFPVPPERSKEYWMIGTVEKWHRGLGAQQRERKKASAQSCRQNHPLHMPSLLKELDVALRDVIRSTRIRPRPGESLSGLPSSSTKVPTAVTSRQTSSVPSLVGQLEYLPSLGGIGTKPSGPVAPRSVRSAVAIVGDRISVSSRIFSVSGQNCTGPLRGQQRPTAVGLRIRIMCNPNGGVFDRESRTASSLPPEAWKPAWPPGR